MSPKKCALCDSRITNKNDSNEHLIPNAIGGRKKVAGFICKECNSKSGESWDAELARQLNPLSLFFGISRERGTVPSQVVETTGGNKVQYHPDGRMDIAKPTYEETPHGSGIKVNINARSPREAKKMLAGLKRKFPQINLEEALAHLTAQSHYPDDMIRFALSLGGHEAGRSIVKTALALAVESGVNPASCDAALEYLTKPDGEPCFGYYYERDLVVNRPERVVFHSVAVSGNQDTKQLLGYVEYYSVWRMVLCLSNQYDGHSFSRTYAIDPISGKELDMEVQLSLSREDLAAAYRYEKIPDGAIVQAFDKVIPIGMERRYQSEKNRVIENAVQYAFKNSGAEEGQRMTEEQKRKCVELLMEKVTPFIAHLLKKPKI